MEQKVSQVVDNSQEPESEDESDEDEDDPEPDESEEDKFAKNPFGSASPKQKQAAQPFKNE